ncbi:MAG: TonB-dependent receptor [Bacteroidetes bacterium]|nr:TonB-dependent receptor [Bacteroidota bacterium]
MGKSILYLLHFSLCSVILFAGTTGKIDGVVKSKNTGEPLIGANVMVIGTSLGAATDIEGRFTILYIPPGTYNVQVSCIGYRKLVIKDVRVFIDQTTTINAELEEEAIEVAEQVVIAERKLIKPDVATSGTALSAREIELIPTTNVMSVLGLQAGVRGGWAGGVGISRPNFLSANGAGRVSVQDGLSIRGGSGDEMLFMLDGITVRDPRNNEPSTKIPMSAVQEVTIERGGFNAEYGQVQSGIVHVITKEGGKRGYTGSMQIRFSPPTPKYARVAGVYDINDPRSFALRPFFDDAVCWTGTTSGGWDYYTQREYPTFMGWNEVSRLLCSDSDPTNDLTPAGAQRVFMYETRKAQVNDEFDYDIDAGFGGPVPFVSTYLGDLRFYTSYRTTRDVLVFPLSRPDYRDYDWNFQVTSDITTQMKVRFSGLVGKRFTIRHNWDGNGSYFYPRWASDIASVASYISDPNGLFGLYTDYNFCLSDIGHILVAGKLTHSISNRTFYEVSIEHMRTNYFTRPQNLRDTSKKYEILPGYIVDSNPFGYWPYNVRGVIITGSQHFAYPRDFSRFNSTAIKADITSQVNFENLLKAGVELVYYDLNFDYGRLQAGGQATEQYANRVKMRVYPLRGALYIQDKLELKEFTLNAGLRLDFSYANVEWWDLNPFDREFFSSLYNPNKQYRTAKQKVQWQLSPRLGIAHPISENAKLFFNYGHFKQLPQYESMFRVERNSQRAVTSFGNPSLTLAKTISYELGFDYSISDQFLIQAAGFYNDVTDLQDITTYQSQVYGFSYAKTTANNYRDTRGFELTVRKSSGEWWTGFANYTYQVITTGHFGSAVQYDDRTLQKQYDEATVNLYQDRPIPQPFARVNLTFMSPRTFGPTLLGHHILGDIGLNVVFDWQAGGYTTWSPNDPYIAYNVKTVDFYNTYLRLEKGINFGNFRLQFFIDVDNVFNTLRLWNTGDQDYLRSLHLPPSHAYNNIPGNDKVGEYRKPGVEYQPMEHVGRLGDPNAGRYEPRAWYYEDFSGKYYQWVDDPSTGLKKWQEVDPERVKKVLADKAYIDMPSASTFWFLNPRRFFFGVKLSFNFE